MSQTGSAVLDLLSSAEGLLRQGRKFGIRVVASPAALETMVQLAEARDAEAREHFLSLIANIVSTEHLADPDVFPGAALIDHFAESAKDARAYGLKIIEVRDDAETRRMLDPGPES